MADKKIIVAYDGSPGSSKALAFAAELAKTAAAEIALVAVIDLNPLLFSDAGDVVGEIDILERKLKEVVDQGKHEAETLGIAATTALLKGNPADTIISYAEREKAYLLVVGSRGLGGFDRLLLGSVAQALVTHSTRPVLVVK